MADGLIGGLGGLVGIGVMAGAANAVIKQTQPKKDRKRKDRRVYKSKSFMHTMDGRIKRML